MEDNGSIIPAQAMNAIAGAKPDEIAAMAESVVEATRTTSQAADELENLSRCIADFSETHERYQKNVKHVKNQMRYLSAHI